MTPQTKHYLIVGGGLAAAVIIGIVVYKKVEANSGASQAAQDQSSQDQLAYLEASSLQNAYSGFSGGGSISLPAAAPQQSLAAEIASIETAFGFGPPPAPAAPASPVSPAAPSLPTTRGGSPVPPLPARHFAFTPQQALQFSAEPPRLLMDHEAFIQ